MIEAEDRAEALASERSAPVQNLQVEGRAYGSSDAKSPFPASSLVSRQHHARSVPALALVHSPSHLGSLPELQNWNHIKRLSPGELYLGPYRMSVDEIFYATVGFGEPLRNDIQHDRLSSGSSPLPSGSFFVEGVDWYSTGLRRLVHGAMQYFLTHSEPKILKQHQQQKRPLGLVQPYPGRLAKRNEHASITVFTYHSPARIVASREHLTKYYDGDLATGKPLAESEDLLHEPGFASAEDDAPDSAPEEFDYLYKWRKVDDDTVLDALGDSGTEGGYDSDTWEEMQQEAESARKGHKGLKQGTLSKEEVSAIIDSCIEDLIEMWKEEKLPKRERTAWHKWQTSRRERTKVQQILKAQDLINTLSNDRLPKLRKAIMDEVYSSEAQVRKQGGNLEESVFDREDQKWLIETLSRRTKPERPPRREPKTRKSRTPRVNESDADDVEVLESESSTDDDAAEEERRAAEEERRAAEFVVPDSPGRPMSAMDISDDEIVGVGKPDSVPVAGDEDQIVEVGANVEHKGAAGADAADMVLNGNLGANPTDVPDDDSEDDIVIRNRERTRKARGEPDTQTHENAALLTCRSRKLSYRLR